MGLTRCVFALTVLLLTLSLCAASRRARLQACRSARDRCGAGEKCLAMYSCAPRPCDGGYIPRCVPDYEYAGLCDLEVSRGMCMASFRRFYYRKEDGTCKQFYFGGCGGNGNRFDTMVECEARCIGLVGSSSSSESDERLGSYEHK